jgi:hypothetical protein
MACLPNCNLSKLHGIPIGIKDNICSDGLNCTAGKQRRSEPRLSRGAAHGRFALPSPVRFRGVTSRTLPSICQLARLRSGASLADVLLPECRTALQACPPCCRLDLFKAAQSASVFVFNLASLPNGSDTALLILLQGRTTCWGRTTRRPPLWTTSLLRAASSWPRWPSASGPSSAAPTGSPAGQPAGGRPL